MFKRLQETIQQRYNALATGEAFTFYKNIDANNGREKVWELYLTAFPETTRQEHNCNCCKQFIRQFSGITFIKNNKIESIWDIDLELIDEYYRPSVVAVRDYIKALPITDVFLSETLKVGTMQNFDTVREIIWSHFALQLTNGKTKLDDIPSLQGKYRTAKETFKRALEEIKVDAIETVIDLVAQDSLYRGAEHVGRVKLLLEFKNKYDKLNAEEKECFVWKESLANPSITSIRGDVIGTLLCDLSDEVPLDTAVKKFEDKVSGTNYKRPKALITPKMIENAKKTLADLGYLEALERRLAVESDLKITDILFVDNADAPITDVFGTMTKEVKVNPKTLSKVEEVSIDDFINKVLPKAKNVELLLENKHLNNLVSLVTAKDPEAKNMFKWNNPFTLAYTGGNADSMRERVVAAGGRVDGVFRFTHSWNHDGKNQSLMDLHVFMPGCVHEYGTNKHNNYGNGGQRVGWNKRSDPQSGGVQDVDYTNAPGATFVPIENITFPTLSKMPEGVYECKIHNWSKRDPSTSGFKAEIEFGGQVFSYSYEKAMANHEWVHVASVTLKAGQFSIVHHIPESTATKTRWGVTTNQYVKAKHIMLSPNFWEGEVGNKHFLFILDGCISDEPTKPFLNEFLKEELNVHRKVFEVLAGKLSIEPSNNQLSGVGFSSTQRNSLIVRVTGTFKRDLKINF